MLAAYEGETMMRFLGTRALCTETAGVSRVLVAGVERAITAEPGREVGGEERERRRKRSSSCRQGGQTERDHEIDVGSGKERRRRRQAGDMICSGLSRHGAA